MFIGDFFVTVDHFRVPIDRVYQGSHPLKTKNGKLITEARSCQVKVFSMEQYNDAKNASTGQGTTVRAQIEKLMPLSVGVSNCHSGDQYRRRIGIIRAGNKAFSSLGMSFSWDESEHTYKIRVSKKVKSA